jgi:predicted amino acid dehydrogenase
MVPPMKAEIPTTAEPLAPPVRFCFVVHALSRIHRGIMGVRSANMGLVGQWRDGTDPSDVMRVCSLALNGVAEGVVVAVPMVPQDLLGNQERAVERMQQAVALAGDIDAVGLGSLCAVVGGRGEELASRLSVPVTNGGAATAWAILENTRLVLQHRPPGPVAVLGARGPVGRVVAASLAQDGIEVRVDHPRAAKGLDVQPANGPADAVKGCSVVVGAGSTGRTLSAEALSPGSVVIDVAIPGTIIGRPDPSVTILAGEAVSFPAHWERGVWGWLYHVLSGYGPAQVFACLLEPLVLASLHRETPFSIGRQLTVGDVASFGAAATALGFRAHLSRGWRSFSPSQLQIPG